MAKKEHYKANIALNSWHLSKLKHVSIRHLVLSLSILGTEEGLYWARTKSIKFHIKIFWNIKL